MATWAYGIRMAIVIACLGFSASLCAEGNIKPPIVAFLVSFGLGLYIFTQKRENENKQ